MCKTTALHYQFVNPNPPTVLEEALERILLEKILAELAYRELLPEEEKDPP